MSDLASLWKRLRENASKSLLKKHLTPDRYEKLKNRKTKLGGTLADCIRSGKKLRWGEGVAKWGHALLNALPAYTPVESSAGRRYGVWKSGGYLSICIKMHRHAQDKHRVTWHNDIYIENINRIFVFKCIAFWVILNAYDVYIIALYECNFACMWFATRGTEQYFT